MRKFDACDFVATASTEEDGQKMKSAEQFSVRLRRHKKDQLLSKKRQVNYQRLRGRQESWYEEGEDVPYSSRGEHSQGVSFRD